MSESLLGKQKQWAEDQNRPFSKEGREMGNRDLKRCLTSVIIRKMKNQNPNEISPHTCQIGYYPKNKEEQVSVRVWRRGDPLWTVGGNECFSATLGKRMKVPEKVKNRTKTRSSHSAPGCVSEGNQNPAILTAALVSIAKTWKQRNIHQWYVYTMEYYSAIGKKGNPALCDN